ncbi:MAG: YraN family protein [Patescibacteria group bacterium]
MEIPADPRRRFGNRGEDLAAAFFIGRGFRIVGRNWNCRAGEIDLIVEREEKLHFVEVKTRRSLAYGYPEASITRKKLQHFARAIELYLRAMTFPSINYQADALAILVKHDGPPEYHYVEHIL